MRHRTLRTLLATCALAIPCALGACSPEREGRPVIGSQSYGEPEGELHSARISGYSWERPGAAEEPPAKPLVAHEEAEPESY